ncbi:MAG: hypothetical protein RR553_08970 [Akkermansia sp.]
MRFLSAICLGAMLLVTSCSHESYIDYVREIPVKSTEIPTVELGLHRANTTYLMHGAITLQEKKDRMGQYYYVLWQDGQPDQKAQLTMHYQQAATGSKVLTKTIIYPPKRNSGEKRAEFVFNGPEHKTQGDVLAWKLILSINGKPISIRKSYLWRDDETTKISSIPSRSI